MRKEIVNKYYLVYYDAKDHTDEDLDILINPSKSELKDILNKYESEGKTNVVLSYGKEVNLVILGNVISGVPYRYVEVIIESSDRLDSVEFQPSDTGINYMVIGENLDMILEYILTSKDGFSSLTINDHTMIIHESTRNKNEKR